MYDEGTASLLAAAVRARMSILDHRRAGRGQDHPAAGAAARVRPERADHGARTAARAAARTPPRSATTRCSRWVERVRNMEGEGEVTLADLGLGDQAAQPRPHRGRRGPRPRGASTCSRRRARASPGRCARCTPRTRSACSAGILLYARQGHGDLAAADVLETAVAGAGPGGAPRPPARRTPPARRDHPRGRLRPGHQPGGDQPVVRPRPATAPRSPTRTPRSPPGCSAS